MVTRLKRYVSIGMVAREGVTLRMLEESLTLRECRASREIAAIRDRERPPGGADDAFLDVAFSSPGDGRIMTLVKQTVRARWRA